MTVAGTPASSACSPVAAAQQGHAICLCSKVTKRNICHQVAEMSCFNCSLAGWIEGKRRTISSETSPHGQLCFGGPQGHAKMQIQLPYFPAHAALVPPLSLFFVCFPQFLLFVSGGFSSMVELSEPEQGQLQLLQSASIGIKSHHREQGSVPAVTYTFPKPSCSKCLHKSSQWMCPGPRIDLRTSSSLPPHRHCSSRGTGTATSVWTCTVTLQCPPLLQLLPLISAHPKCPPW